MNTHHISPVTPARRTTAMNRPRIHPARRVATLLALVALALIAALAVSKP